MLTTTPPAHRDHAAFLAAVRRSDLLTDAEFVKAASGVPAAARTAAQVANHFVTSGVLTRFQADRLLAGKTEGFRLGRYVILEPLGKGKVGQAYKARHVAMDRLVTVEVLPPAWSESAEARAGFHKEARAAARLAHPNLVTVLDADAAGDRLYAVLEYVDGADLDATVRGQGALPVDRACEYARQAALGLAHAHEKGMVHGGLCPAALLVGRAGGTGPADRPVVKVLNMGLSGLALFAAETGDLHAAAAAAEYLAPEQLTHPGRADPRADLYSLGCTLYFLLTGQPPRPVADGPLLHQLGAAVPVDQIRPDVPPGVAAIVRQLMDPDPARRPASAAEVAGWLAALAGGEGTGSDRGFALPRAAAPGPVTGFLAARHAPPPEREPSPFADLEDDGIGRTPPRTGGTAGLLALAAGIIAVVGVAVAFVVRTLGK